MEGGWKPLYLPPLTPIWNVNQEGIYVTSNAVIGTNQEDDGATLTVQGDTPGDGILVKRSGSPVRTELWSDFQEGGIGTRSNHDFRFITNSSIAGEILSNGNWAIGGTSAPERLSVNGAIKIGATSTNNNGTIKYENGKFLFRESGSWKELGAGSGLDNDSTNEIQTLSLTSNQLSLSNGGGTITLPTSGGGTVWSQNSEGLFYEGGNVNIGGTAGSLVKFSVNTEESLWGQIIANGTDVNCNGCEQVGLWNIVGGDGDESKIGIKNNVVVGGTSAGEDVYGIKSVVSEADKNGVYYGIHSVVESSNAPSSAYAAAVYGEVNENQYVGIHGKNTLGGLAGWFEGSVDVSKDLTVRSELDVIGGIDSKGGLRVDNFKSVELTGGGFKLADLSSFGGGQLELTGGTATNLNVGAIGLYANYKQSNSPALVMKLPTGQPSLIIDANPTSPTLSFSSPSSDSEIVLATNFNGDSRVITDELQIKGGSDFAENFDVVDTYLEPAPGMAVSIDEDNPGKLSISRESYDKKVAGIISGANGVETGLFMGQEGSIADGEYPIALSGRVYVYANGEGGEILPGDLLTTSSVSGEAMKASDFDKSHGAIIGKAMTGLDENGFVLVLVNLQ